MIFTIRQRGISLLPIFIAFACPAAGETPAETRSTLKEWIELETTISKEEADWQSEKQILKDRIELLMSEKNRLTALIDSADGNISKAEGKRLELNETLSEMKDLSKSLEAPFAQYESEVRGLYPSFPPPLQEEIKRLYDRIPSDPEETRLGLGERLQAVVGVLNFADKFNSGIQREVEIRLIDSLQIEVETLYFGLAAAYFSDAEGRHAGIGIPGEEGWVWKEIPEHADQILRLIQIYHGTAEAEFTAIPASIQ